MKLELNDVLRLAKEVIVAAEYRFEIIVIRKGETTG